MASKFVKEGGKIKFSSVHEHYDVQRNLVAWFLDHPTALKAGLYKGREIWQGLCEIEIFSEFSCYELKEIFDRLLDKVDMRNFLNLNSDGSKQLDSGLRQGTNAGPRPVFEEFEVEVSWRPVYRRWFRYV